MGMQQAARLGSRALFEALEVPVYLNHASISPPSTTVQAAVAASLAGYAGAGMGWYEEEVARRQRLRSQLEQLIAAEPGSVALLGNTSLGVLAVALNLDWQAGERVLVLEGEFPTNVLPWQQAARQHELELVWLSAEDFRLRREQALADLEQELQRGLRLVAVSAVQFSTGQRMPLAEMTALCHRHGAELFVDGIQAAGIVPLDVQALGVDYLASGGHKWLMAPEGAGFLYVAPERARRLRPNFAAWLSQPEPFIFLERAPGELRYDRPYLHSALLAEVGTPAALSLAGLEASLRLLLGLGVEQIFEHVQAWHGAAEPGLIERGFRSARMQSPAGRSGILSVQPADPSTASAWARALGAQGISCASPDGWIRLSPHWPNSLEEPQQLLAAVDAIRAAGGP